MVKQVETDKKRQSDYVDGLSQDEAYLDLESGLPTQQLDTPIRQYLREIGRYPLLSAEQEMKIAALMADGDLEAQQQMIKANLRLVVYIAKSYPTRNCSLLDLIQEGNLGLMHAAQKFDPRLGYRFSTYATRWIHQSIRRAIVEHAQMIHIPTRAVNEIYKLKRVVQQLYQELGHDPSTDEIARALNATRERVIELRSMAETPISLDTPLLDEEQLQLSDMLQDNGTRAGATAHEDLHDLINTALGALGERERHIIKLRYGLQDGYCHTPAEVGVYFNLTRERIRQIEARALRTLQGPIKDILHKDSL